MLKRAMNIKITVSCLLSLWILGCATTRPPARPENLCSIFGEKPQWYQDALSSQKRWGIPIPVMMAIMYQESAFNADARPPRTSCLFFFPGPYPSSAYGYSQALDGTWENYQRDTGSRGADRDDFHDAIDFIGWYCYLSFSKSGIAGNDAYQLYLAYHEGHSGFNRRTYRNKPWLMNAAGRVEERAKRYAGQLAYCEKR
ncbi:MAG: hypothetical protein BWK80_40910 [Desulfobacteraceae bacterium IS3]|nr:MAG: hypothetical protein BWK80_40910 [Desulfobacteraceae bacterium IS3]